MPKVRQTFVCRECGSVLARWMGKCPDCGAWDSLDAQTADASAAKDRQKGIVQAWSALGDDAEPDAASAPAARALGQINPADAPPRLPTGIAEFDRVLGGAEGARGLVPGSAVLIGGAPGIGKSTLLLQAAAALADRSTRVLYVSSEESEEQVRLRATRLPLGPGVRDNLFILADTNLARIVEQARRTTPAVLVIDSIQMVYKGDLDAPAGSLTQLRRCCADLVFLAKASGMAVVMVGHVTKEGALAGPRLLEHLVDVVVAFEGDRYHAHRIVRAIKNRFGTTMELGIFEMGGAGLVEAPEGAGVAAVTGDATPRPGSVVAPIMHGTRCVLVELQALTATGFPGSVKRKASGVDANRLAMLVAVLEQHAGQRLYDRDIFASSVGGLKVAEPAADLALLLAIGGAQIRRALDPRTAALGEVGLGGEVRPVAHLEQRLREAARLGYTRALVPAGPPTPSVPRDVKITLDRVRSIGEAMERLE